MVLTQEQWTTIRQAGGTTEDIDRLERGEAEWDWEA